MSTTESRLSALIDEHLDLGHAPDFDMAFGDAGVSSLDCVAFVKLVTKEFAVEISPEEWMGLRSLRGLAAHIDAAT
ncbi:MAG: acyl carrier protein [Gemmatimonadetes bacterium]|nr:acyl carrier protein [Gemmatimonadota bacterium]